jgi:transposase InsO family protein
MQESIRTCVTAVAYLAAVVDWFSRRVLSWRVSIDMAADFCVEAVEEALAKHGRPKIFNTDQGYACVSRPRGLLSASGWVWA